MGSQVEGHSSVMSRNLTKNVYSLGVQGPPSLSIPCREMPPGSGVFRANCTAKVRGNCSQIGGILPAFHPPTHHEDIFVVVVVCLPPLARIVQSENRFVLDHME